MGQAPSFFRALSARALSALASLRSGAPAFFRTLPTRALAAARAAPAKLKSDARYRTGAAGGAAALTALIVLAFLGDPSRAYAVARVELPAMPRSASLGPPLGIDSPVAALPRPRPVLRATADEPAPRQLAMEHPEGGALAARAATPTFAPGHAAGEDAAHADLPEGALTRAPIEALARSGPGGLLPRIGADGRTPADSYARPFADESGSPLIAVVVGGLGLNASATREAIESLPPDVTLSFVPYAENLQGWIDAAREAGHEVILELPMEPYDYPANDPGPHTLLARADQVENHRRLEWLMSRGTGYFAVMNYLGARFTAEPAALTPVLEAIAESGVAFLYDGETRRADLDRLAVEAGLSLAAADRILDAEPNAAAVDEQLLLLEAAAMQKGDAIGAGFGYPITVRQVRAWAGTLPLKGYALAPASVVLARRAEASRLRVAQMAAEAPAARPSFSSVPASFGGGGEASGGGRGGSGGGSGGGAHH